MTSSSEERRTPRKRATRKRASSTRVAQETALRTRRFASNKDRELNIPREVEAPKPAVRPSEPVADRKAPTSFASAKASRSLHKRRLKVVITVLIVGVGASAAVGLTDVGQIDVQKTIEARNERIRNNQADERDLMVSQVEVPVQNTNVGKADGGLVGRGVGTVPALPKAVPASTTATSTATSTDATASSTSPTDQAASSSESTTISE